MTIEQRLTELGRRLVDREAAQADQRARAHRVAVSLHRRAERALKAYHDTVLPSMPALCVRLSEPRVDDKHLHAVEFDLERGSHRAIVTVKHREEVTLVGPFRLGKTEGPCLSFPVAAESEIEKALDQFLYAFIEAAVSP